MKSIITQKPPLWGGFYYPLVIQLGHSRITGQNYLLNIAVLSLSNDSNPAGSVNHVAPAEVAYLTLCTNALRFVVEDIEDDANVAESVTAFVFPSPNDVRAESFGTTLTVVVATIAFVDAFLRPITAVVEATNMSPPFAVRFSLISAVAETPIPF